MTTMVLLFLGLGFWVFLTVAAVAGMITEYKKRQMELEPLRAAIERGQQLDPAIIERLMARERHQTEVKPVNLRIGGILAVAGGIGLGVFSWAISNISMKAFYPVLGAGVLAICAGVGLLIGARALERDRAKNQHETSLAIRGPGA
jgi:hypothetical protein